MVFKNRMQAGLQLAKRLLRFAGRHDVVVLGIPCGGVPVAFAIAISLRLPLDVFLSRKLGVPGDEELAFGAVAASDGRYLDQNVIRQAAITPEQVEEVTARVRLKLAESSTLYRGVRPALKIEGQTVILVDDGIATGASVYTALNALRQMKPSGLVLATPVAPHTTCNWLRNQVDEFACLDEPKNFEAVGQFYSDFSDVHDDEVIALLKQAEAARRQDVQ